MPKRKEEASDLMKGQSGLVGELPDMMSALEGEGIMEKRT